jgi:Glycosyltransferase family 87
VSAEASSRAHDPAALRFRGVVSEPLVGAPPAPIPRAGAPRFRVSQLRPRGREWLVERQGWLGFAGLLLTGALIALSAARTALLLPASMRPIPYASLAGAFGQGGIDLGLGGLIAVMILMFVAYAAMVRGVNQLTARPVLIGIACLNLLVLLAPTLLSTDVFSYMAYGRIGAVYGSNPYVYGPSSFLLDPLYPYIGSQWVNTPTAYGPLFTAISYLFAHLTIATNVIAYKLIAAVSSLAIVLVVWNAARLRGLNPVKVVAIVGLNPVILVYGVGGGHNDLLMLAISMIAVYVLLQQKQRTSGALIVTAAAVKLTAGLMLPFALAQGGSERTGPARRRRLLVGAGITAAIVVIFSFAAFGFGSLHLFGTLAKIQSHGGWHSIPGLLFGPFNSHTLYTIADSVAEAVMVGCLVWLVRRVWTGRLDWITGAGWATVVMLLTAGLLVPWYVAWLVPLAALSKDRRLLVATVLLTGIGLTTL